jgi:hypothetical protein
MAPATRPSEPPRPQPAAARSNVVPITSRLATAERLDEAPNPASERLSLAPDPFAAPAALAAPAVTSTSVSATAPSASAAAASSPNAQAPVIVQMPRQPNYVGIGMILAMVAFGGVAAWALFFKTAPPPAPTPTIVTQYLPAPTAPPISSGAADNAAPADSAATSPSAKAHSLATAPKAAASGSGAPLDLKGLGGSGASGANPLAGLGLAPTGPAAPTGGGGGGGLSSSQLEGVVRMHKAAVTRTCWTGIGGGGSSSASEMMHIVIDGSGHVTSVHADGSNSQVGGCLEREIKGWIFPPAGGSSTVDVPFKFMNQ